MFNTQTVLSRLVPLPCVLLALACGSPPAPQPAARSEIAIPRVDGSSQPAFVITPSGYDPAAGRYPLVVSLHTWSNGYEQRHEELESLVQQKGWIYLFPDFRGRNDNPLACGSEAAQQDILDAVAWAKQSYPVDEKRIYLTGTSGGGHMSLLMAGRYPHVWTAVSAWVPISDLAAWYASHPGDDYGEMTRASMGGPPGASAAVDEEYRQRSPLTWLSAAKDLPVDIAAGVRDGHEGSVPIRQTLEAFNAIASAAGGETVSEEEIQQLSAGPEARLAAPKPSDNELDEALGRAIYLRRTAGRSRVTIFEGGHEGIASAQVDWLEKF
jgi:dipeptidyl aminopeptidase/acylaminoacyl peptidase